MGKRGNSASRFGARDAEEQRKGQGSDDSDDAENRRGVLGSMGASCI